MDPQHLYKSGFRSEVLEEMARKIIELYAQGVAIQKSTGVNVTWQQFRKPWKDERFIKLVDVIVSDAEDAEQEAQSTEFYSELNSYYNDSRI